MCIGAISVPSSAVKAPTSTPRKASSGVVGRRPSLEQLGKLRKEFGRAEGPQGRASGSERVNWQQREKGCPHHTAVRALAFKWQRVIFRCWQDHTVYDDARYEAVLRKRKSPLVKRFDQIEVGKSPWKTAQKNLNKSLVGSPQR